MHRHQKYEELAIDGIKKVGYTLHSKNHLLVNYWRVVVVVGKDCFFFCVYYSPRTRSWVTHSSWIIIPAVWSTSSLAWLWSISLPLWAISFFCSFTSYWRYTSWSRTSHSLFLVLHTENAEKNKRLEYFIQKLPIYHLNWINLIMNQCTIHYHSHFRLYLDSKVHQTI